MPREVARIFVVDDASTDQTAARARAVNDPRVCVLQHAQNRGVGAAIASGYRAALAEPGDDDDALVVMAGDGQMSPADLPRVVAALRDADYVKGNRMPHAAVRARMPKSRYFASKVLSKLTSWALQTPIEDSQCGYTALRRAAARTLDLDALWPRFGYPNDLLGQLVARGLRVREVMVEPVYGDERSHLRAWHVPTIGFLIARAALRVRARKRWTRAAFGLKGQRSARAERSLQGEPFDDHTGRPAA